MPDSLTAQLLAEIERREKLETFRHGFPVGPFATPVDTTDVRAYLGALRTVVEIHTGAHSCTTRSGVPLDIDHEDHCPTITAVATALGVSV